MTSFDCGESDCGRPLYPEMVKKLYDDGTLPVIIPVVPGERMFWAVYSIPDKSVLVQGDDDDREDALLRVIHMTGKVAWGQ